jgi:ATP-dependent Clp protease ATP-binding subunit ClpC
MFNRFTAAGRQAMSAAREEAISLGHNYLGTEHLLLGALHTEPVRSVLDGFGFGRDDARTRVVDVVGRVTKDEEELPGELASTPRTMDVLVLAWNEARRENDIGPEHILLALVREGQGVAAHVLRDAGISEERVRRELRGN